jgi:hypothetical protein
MLKNLYGVFLCVLPCLSIAMETEEPWHPFEGDANLFISIRNGEPKSLLENEKNLKAFDEQMEQIKSIDQTNVSVENANIAFMLKTVKNMLLAVSNHLYNQATRRFITANCMLFMKISEYINKVADFKVRTQTFLIPRDKRYFLFVDMGFYEFLKQNKRFFMITDEKENDFFIMTNQLYNNPLFRIINLRKSSALKLLFWIYGYSYFILQNSTMPIFKALLANFIFNNNRQNIPVDLNLITVDEQAIHDAEPKSTPSKLPWYKQWRWNLNWSGFYY